MYNLTLQNAGGDSVITSGDVLGRISFAVPSESDGTAATYIASQIYCQAEGSFTSASNPASVIIATSSSDAAPATGRLKISQDGHVVPIASGQYDLGSAASLFRNAYVNTGILDIIQFNTNNGSVNSQGQLGWNDTEGTLDISLTDSTVMEIGQHKFFRVRNTTGSPLYKGQVVYASGVHANGIITPNLYIANGTIDEIRFIGLVFDTIADNNNGYVIDFGHLRDLDLDGSATNYAVGDESWANGDILYAHPTVAGKLTKIEPKHAISLAIILSNASSNGQLFVRPTNFGDLSYNHDVDVSGVTNGQFLQYNSTTDYWVPSSSGNFTSLQVNSTAVPTGIGASNYVTKWTGTNSLGTGIIYDDGTSVGIGTNTPIGKLNIENGDFIFNSASGNHFFVVGGSGNPNLFVVNGIANQVGIGGSTLVPGFTLNVNGSFRSDTAVIGTGSIPLPSRPIEILNHTNIDELSIRLRSDRFGNYISGYTFPTSDGSSGQALLTNGSGVVNWSSVVLGSGISNYVPKWINSTTLTSGLIYDDGNHIGIGNNPNGHLDSFSTYGPSLVLGNGSGDVGQFFYSTNNASIWFTNGTELNNLRGQITYLHSEDKLAFGTSGVGISMALDANGNLGIGQNYPSARLNVEGGNIVFNDLGGNFDFRVEGDTDANLLFTDASADKIGIGCNPSLGKLHLQYLHTDNNGGVGTDAIYIDHRHTVNTNGTYNHASIELLGKKLVSSGINDTGQIIGAELTATLDGPGSLTNSYGLRTYGGIHTSSSGTLTNAWGANLRVINGGFHGASITNAYGVDVQIEGDLFNRIDGNSITSAMGIRIRDIGSATNRWGIYQMGANDLNYFAGNVGVGISNPSNKLQVENGSVVFNSAAGNYDFTVGGDTDIHTLCVDASADSVGIGLNTPLSTLHIEKNGVTSLRLQRSVAVGTAAVPVERSHILFSNYNNVYDHIKLISWGRESNFLAGMLGVNISNSAGVSSEVLTIDNQSTAGTFGLRTYNIPLVTTSGNVIFNETAGNFDFRAEGLTDPNLLFVDASSDRVGVGTSSPTHKLHVAGSGYMDWTQLQSNYYINYPIPGSIAGNSNRDQIILFAPTGVATLFRGYIDSNSTATSNEYLRNFSRTFIHYRTSADVNTVPQVTVNGVYNGNQSDLAANDNGRVVKVLHSGVEYWGLIMQDLSAFQNPGAPVFNGYASSLTNLQYGHRDGFTTVTDITPNTTAGRSASLFRYQNLSVPDGNVGVGTNNPTSRLHVEGGNVVFNDAGDNFDFRVEGDTDANLFFTDASADSVGIGTSTPSGKLHVVGTTRLIGPIIEGYNNAGNTGTAQTIVLTNGTIQNYTLTGNCTFTMPTATAGQSFTVMLRTGAGSFTSTFTNVKWPNNTAPTITTTASRMDLITFVSDGTNWYGTFAQNYTV